jgi:pimeloyl-ACP methyl ester carboxylesterase
MIQERNGGKKVAYVGHSQGTTQTLAGMALIPEWYDKNVSTGVMLGPCTFPNQSYMATYTQANWDYMYANNIWATTTTYGPSWTAK